MSSWHVGRNGQSLPQREYSELLAAVEAGEIVAGDLVWTDGMPEWKKVSELPELAARLPVGSVPSAPAVPVGVMNYQMPQSGNVLCTTVALESLRGTKGWVRFVAVLLFVMGGLCALGGVFVVVGPISRTGPAWMPMAMGGMYAAITVAYLLMGLYLNRFAGAIKQLMVYRREDHLEQAMEHQRKFWRLVGIMIIAGFALYFVGVAVVVFVTMKR
jgi:hypothetical protein